MDAIFITIAFGLGLAVRQFRLPPMVGFLVAGFILQATGQEAGNDLRALADLGVKLLLFSIGLKLQVKNLTRPEIWATTTLLSGFVLLLFTPVIFGLAGLAFDLSWQTALLLALAFSFSSTVFAIRTLDDNGDLGALHGKAAIGILVM